MATLRNRYLGGQKARKFFLRRSIRIAPLYWAVSAVFIVFFLTAPNGFTATIAASNTSIGTIIASFMFLPLPRPDGAMFPLLSLGWTLNYEVFFYVIFAGAIILPRERAVAAVGILFVLIVAAGHLFCAATTAIRILVRSNHL